MQTHLPIRNRLLSMLPDAEPYCEPVTLEQDTTLLDPKQPEKFVFFPEEAVLALFGVAECGGRGVGLGLIGREGMAGIGLSLGAPSVFTRILVQRGGSAWKMNASHLREQLLERPETQWRIFRHVYSSMMQARQVAVCSNFHETLPRLVRWLLVTRDRTESCEMALTQEYLARMLGVRRASVTEAACELQQRSLISYCRGRIKLLDDQQLESVACPCYQAIRRVDDFNLTAGRSSSASDAVAAHVPLG